MDRNARAHAPRQTSSLVCLVLTVASTALFATGVGARPAGLLWDRIYDVVLYDAPYLFAVVLCWLAGGRVRAERTAWRALAVAFLLSIVGNSVRTWSTGVAGAGDYPLLADAFNLAGYLTLYVTLVVLIRARVPRFHPSMWLDGVIGALGTMAVGVGFLIGPYLSGSGERPPLPLVELAMPTFDVLLLALLVAVGAILGARLDRTLLLVSVAMCCVLAGDVVQFTRTVDGTFADGTPLDLTWLAGVCLVGLAAHGARVQPAAAPGGGRRSRVGWRILALPLACNVASLLVLAVGWGDRMPAVAAWLAIGCVLAALARMAVTFREVRALNEVRLQARTDELSGLPNRRALLEGAQRMLDDATAARPAALLLLDLDGFKEINDSLGHHAGDQLLRQVGPRLADDLGEGGLLGRLGGDEFAVLLPEASLDEAEARAERLRELILQPFTVEGIRLHVGVSIGVATAPVPAANVAELLRCADVAMYAAKSSREGVHVYVPDPDGGAGDRLRTMEDLRTALETDQLLVHLQPQVSLADGRVVGAEALVRWQHPRRGLLSPAELLPAAEQAGLLRQLTDTVLELSLDARRPLVARTPRAGVGQPLGGQRHRPRPARKGPGRPRCDTACPPTPSRSNWSRTPSCPTPSGAARFSASSAGSASARRSTTTAPGTARLPTCGTCRPTSSSSTGASPTTSGPIPRAAVIVKHTVALAHDLGISLVAEGVEDDATGLVLRDLGCDVAQGWAIARPMPVADFLDWLERPARPLHATPEAAARG